MRDAACLAIGAFRKMHPDEMARAREWKKLADDLGIEVVENDDLAKQRFESAMKAVHADLLGDED